MISTLPWFRRRRRRIRTSLLEGLMALVIERPACHARNQKDCGNQCKWTTALWTVINDVHRFWLQARFTITPGFVLVYLATGGLSAPALHWFCNLQRFDHFFAALKSLGWHLCKRLQHNSFNSPAHRGIQSRQFRRGPRNVCLFD